ncbi:MAG: tRNA preQ1(34) S-adenosylmethionine ribosyltransferase-isomerase QueA [Woeseiaceae bacterium]
MRLLPCAPMQLSDFDYALPEELIAQYPAGERRASRLLVVNAEQRTLVDRQFADLPALLNPGDLLVFNDTRVIRARLHGFKETGGRVEILIERVLSDSMALAQLRASKPLRPNTKVQLAGGGVATVVGRDRGFYRLEFGLPLMPYLEEYGEVPLPPYLHREADPADTERYQTVYARHDGAVAAPTAGLHFDEDMLRETRDMDVRHAYVTLHVGAGTFQPLRREDIESNRLHAERLVVDEMTCRAVEQTRKEGGRVIAVGTTSVRALESASADGGLKPFDGETELFIVPGYCFKSIDAMITNFHLPQSSLLMLVAAFAGTTCILDAYRHAIGGRYRFFSYGDSMFIIPGEETSTPSRRY